MNESIRQAAQRIIASMQSMYGGEFTYLPVDEVQFRHLDLRAYREFQARHEAKAFRHLCDVEIAEVSHSPTTILARTYIRSMVSAHGAVAADYYQVRPRMDRLWRMLLRGLGNGRWIDAPRFFLRTLKTRHCVGYTTELGNGHFIVTSNAQAASKIGSPPTIDNEFHPYGTLTQVVMDRHMVRLRSRLEAEPQLRVRMLGSAEELEAQRRRMKQQKDAYRASVDWVSKEELANMGSDPRVAAAIYEEVRRQLGVTAEGPGSRPPAQETLSA
ncbi:hypothetical protein ABZR86_17900 [Dyella marensis]|uniref:Uncharacterized protein n=1 Tax=Dyella marensis TaxID=500610 RepID=A0A1I2J1D9_9GAMM|nr:MULTISPECIES: hypothetical protein [Dyella]SFF48294.1 hypothetical protein SAMN02799615_03788 [Dyella marensis]